MSVLQRFVKDTRPHWSLKSVFLQLEARELKPPDSQGAHPNWIIQSGRDRETKVRGVISPRSAGCVSVCLCVMENLSHGLKKPCNKSVKTNCG